MAALTKIQLRRDTAANWVTAQTAAGATPVLAAGEIGFETDTQKFKIGVTGTLWGNLKYSQDASLLAGAASITSLTTSGDVIVGGNLTVNGTTTSINSSTLQVDDKNIELGSVAAILGRTVETSANSNIIITSSTTGLIIGQTVTQNTGTFSTGTITSITNATAFRVSSNQGITCTTATVDIGGATNVTADGAGFTVKGATDKTLNWVNTTAAWTSSEDFDLASGKVYEINGTTVLSSTAVLGKSISDTNTANNIVSRDTNGSFAANVVTANLTGVSTLTANVTGGAANEGQLLYQSAVNTTSKLAVATVNNSILSYNTSTNAPAWLNPTQTMGTLTGYSTTATAGGTTTLTNTSTYFQQFTGATTQTVGLPVTSTLSTGWSFYIMNRSTGILTVNSSGGNQVTTVPAGTSVLLTCVATAGTGAANWDARLADFTTVTGTGAVVLNNTPTFVSPVLGAATGTSLSVTGQLISTQATGTAPLSVASNTVVTNLNADLLDGYNTATAATANTVAVRDTNGSITANVFAANAITVTSTTEVSNLRSATANLATNIVGVANVIFYNGTANTTSQLAYSTANNNQVLTITSGVPAWVTPASTGVTSLVAGNGITVSGSTGAVTVNTNAAYATTWTTTQRINVSSDVLAFAVRANATAGTANLIQAFAGDGSTTLMSLSNTGTLFAVTIDGGTA
jgi:hypothetical protein